MVEHSKQAFCVSCGEEFTSRNKDNGKSRHWTRCCSRECAGKLAFRGGPAASRRRRRYGMEPEEYARRLKIQDGKCALCREAPAYDLYVDHHHATKENRGLLCARCNTAVGVFEALSWNEVLTFWGYTHHYEQGVALATNLAAALTAPQTILLDADEAQRLAAEAP